MILKRNLFIIFSVTLFAIASLVLDIFNYNPYTSDLSVFANFYASLLISFAGIFGLTIFLVKVKLNKGKWTSEKFLPSLRQGCILSIALTGLLILKGLNVLDWWVGVPLIIAILLLELFFQTTPPQIKHQKKIKKKIL